LGTGPLVTGQAPNIKVLATSFPSFALDSVRSVKDILFYLARTNSGSKESWIIHLISEKEIEHPEREEKEEEEEEEVKGKGKGKGKGRGKKNARSISISNPVSNSKRAKGCYIFFVRTFTNT
jgi:hypothetical protein